MHPSLAHLPERETPVGQRNEAEFAQHLANGAPPSLEDENVASLQPHRRQPLLDPLPRSPHREQVDLVAMPEIHAAG
jgi:hypothetical protein